MPFTYAPEADAHIELVSPKPRYADLKEGPCGRGSSDVRTTNVTTFAAGETITVTWKETIGHPGHYRISFDTDGTTAFIDPKSFTDVGGGPSVLVDNIGDKTGTQTYSLEVTLPDIACDKCTLQIIQVMTDKPPYGDGNDLYYQCADLVLTKDSSPPDSTPQRGTDPSASESGGCGSAAHRAVPIEGCTAFAGMLAFILAARRRRRA